MEIISVAELKIGMFFAEPDCAWTEFPFALQGFVLTTPQQIELIREKCRFVYVDRSRSLGEHYAEPKIAFDRALRPPLFARKPSDEEVPPGVVAFSIFCIIRKPSMKGPISDAN
jgi:hypothetical protein